MKAKEIGILLGLLVVFVLKIGFIFWICSDWMRGTISDRDLFVILCLMGIKSNLYEIKEKAK